MAETALEEQPEISVPERTLRYPASVSRYDIATRDELLYAYWIGPVVQNQDVRKWTWIKQLVNHTGKWVGAAIDAEKLAMTIQRGCPSRGSTVYGTEGGGARSLCKGRPPVLLV